MITDQSLVHAKALARVAESFQLSDAELAQVLNVPLEEVGSLRTGAKPIQMGSELANRSASLIKVYAALDSILGGDEDQGRQWLRSPNEAVGGIPITVMVTPEGLNHILAYLESARTS